MVFFIRNTGWFSLFFLLCVLTGQGVQANPDCEARKRTIHTRALLNITVAEPFILHDKTLAEINAETQASKQDWLKKNGMQEVWSANELQTLGYAMGGMASASRMQMLSVPYDRYGSYYCPVFKDVDVNLIYRTLIRIPREIPEGSCAYKVILTHELRHHQANKDSFERYMAQLKTDLPRMLAYYEQVPVKRARVQNQFDHMKQAMEEAVKLYIQDYVLVAAQKVNAQIDSPESYALEHEKLESCRGQE